MSDYNGWTNYATWRVNLEMFNGRTVQDITGRAVMPTSELKDALREYVDELLNQWPDGLAKDELRGVVSDVNWWEIADQLIEDVEA